MTQRSFLGSFSRSQVSAAFATGVDFGVLFLLAGAFHVWYVAATAIGALAGATTNFTINRHWSFLAADHPVTSQAFRYAWVSGASMLLNTAGVYVVTETFRIHYAISVFVVSSLVGWGFNFPLHRHYVFR